MKRMNKVKNVIVAKVMGGMVAGLAALAGMAPVTAFAQSQEVTCTCEEKCSEGAVNEECAVCLYDYNVCQGVDAHTINNDVIIKFSQPVYHRSQNQFPAHGIYQRHLYC